MYHGNEGLAYWNDPTVESMYDKHLLDCEIHLLREQIPDGAKILDAGCGEGEGTAVFASIPGAIVHAADFSETRLQKARERLAGKPNVTCKQVDFLGQYDLDRDYDVV